ncbi:serine hydrolase domain-containing protein [Aquiflexum sp.]|uniref:serine hydrolase domain-containing protein n=1 Tax=Aquiflexum sp. TaxID=1872584 RepID=UPI003594335B
MLLKLLFVSLLSLTMLVKGNAQIYDKATLDKYFDRLAEKNKAMGTLVISTEGNAIYSRSIGYGLISETVKNPLTEASRYRIASVTKMYTAVMILQLNEEGRLKLTDPLSNFFPQIPNAGKITIGHILQHRSGISNIRREQDLQGVSKSPLRTIPITKEEMLALIAKGTPDFEPDTDHLYSNSGYFLLGLIIEKLTNKTYEEELKERISSKIGLRNTYLATGNIDVSQNESLTYSYLGGSWKQHIEMHPSILFGAGSIISTPFEMCTFIETLFGLKLISQQSVTLMKTMRDGEGMGMESFQFAGKTFYGHTGGGDNYGAWLAYLPEEKLAIAYTTNAKVHPVADIMKDITDIYFNQPFQIPEFESIYVSPEILDKYVGIYTIEGAPMIFTVTRNGSTLFIQPHGQSAAPLEAIAQDKFEIAPGVVFEFHAAKNQMIVKRPNGERIFTKEN